MNNNPNMEMENSTYIHISRLWKPGHLPSIGKMNMKDAYQSCWSFVDGSSLLSQQNLIAILKKHLSQKS